MSRKLPASYSIAKRQDGYMLVSALFGVVIVSATLLALARSQTRQYEIARVTADGVQASQFAMGLRGFMTRVQANPALLPNGQQAGVDWLKPATCGGLAGNPPEGHVPCSFTGGTLGATYRTTFSYTPATNYLEARTTFVVPALAGDPTTPILNAQRIVLAALSNQGQPNTGMFFTAFANTAPAANAPAPASAAPGANAGRVVMVASNAPSNDIWLRTDGTNSMLANLNMGGMSIGNARDGRFSGDVRIDQRLQVDQGLKVRGPSDLEGGVITNEMAITSIGKYVTEGIYDARVYTGATSYSVPKPNCSQAGNNPGIYVSMQSTGTPNQGSYAADAIYEARADVVDSGSTWTIRPIMSGTRFDFNLSGSNLSFNKQVVQATPSDMRLVVMTRCR